MGYLSFVAVDYFILAYEWRSGRLSVTLFSLSHSAQAYGGHLSDGHGASRRRISARCSTIDVGTASTEPHRIQLTTYLFTSALAEMRMGHMDVVQ